MSKRTVEGRKAFLKIAEAFPELSLDEIMKLIRDAFRGMYRPKAIEK